MLLEIVVRETHETKIKKNEITKQRTLNKTTKNINPRLCADGKTSGSGHFTETTCVRMVYKMVVSLLVSVVFVCFGCVVFVISVCIVVLCVCVELLLCVVCVCVVI